MNSASHAAVAACGVALLTMLAGTASAQSYPTKPVRLIVPYAPGGSTDVIFRILALRLTEILGQQVVIDNRPGAASTVGLEIVAKSPPDGYTVGVNNIAYGANPAIYKKMPFDSEKDFVPVTLVSIVTPVATVHPSIPARSIKQLIALVKSKPGTLVRLGRRCGSANHLATERFAHMAGLKLVHVPPKAAGRQWFPSCRERRRPARDDPIGDPALQDGQARPPCGEQRQAQFGAARAADDLRSRRPRIRGDRMAGARRAHRHAAERDTHALSGDDQGIAAAGNPRESSRARRRVRTARPRSSRSSGEERARGVVQGGEGSRDQDRLGDVLSTPLHDLTATDIVAAVRSETTTCEAVTRACIDRIAKREPQVLA